MTEEWKPCNFDTRYKISNFGNIKRSKSNGDDKFIKPSILNKNRTHPYYYIQIKNEGKRKNYLIHRLVAMAFCENHSEINNVCDHIDRNTFNNHYTNLRWGTQKDNVKNAIHYKSDLPETNRKYYVDKAYREKIVDSKKYYCELCEVKCQTPAHLNSHFESHRHALRTEAKNELGGMYNEVNYKIWRNNRYTSRAKKEYSL